MSSYQTHSPAASTSTVAGGVGESAVPEDKKAEDIERLQNDWEHDPENPRNWSTARKWTMASIISLYTFVSPLASSMMAPGLPEIGEHFGITSPTILALTLSIFILAFALGPLLLGPASEIWGRKPILDFSNLFFLAFNTGCIFAPNTAALIVLRFLAGIGGSAPLAMGGSCIGDLFSERDRAPAMAIYSMGPLLGPVIGPIAGGFIAQSIGFKYVFVIISAMSAVAAVLGVVFLRETYAPVIRAGHASILEKVAPRESILTNIFRPIKLLTRSLICFVLCAYMALTYGYLYMLFTTFPTLFGTTYHFSASLVGLAYLGPGLGFFIGTILAATVLNRIYSTLVERNNGIAKPEHRIPSIFPGSVLIPIGLFWYGWSADRTHWIMPIIGAGLFALGMYITFMAVQLYLVDAFKYSASALAAAALFRSLFGFAFPLFADQMFAALGTGGGYSLLAGLSIVLGIPFPIWIYYRGEAVREKSTLDL